MAHSISHWPPQPIVEDEVTALEHEQISAAAAEALKDDDDPAVSRGAVNQYPIIVDSDDGRSARKTYGAKDRGTKLSSKRAELNSSDDSAGPATPPPLHQKQDRRLSPPGKAKNVSFQESSATSTTKKSSDAQARGRPQVEWIDTSLGADLQAMASGARRAPSPYSYTRPSASDNRSSAQQPNFLSPTKMSTSPLQEQKDSSLQQPAKLSPETKFAFSDEPDATGRERRRHRSDNRARSRSHHRESSKQRESRDSVESRKPIKEASDVSISGKSKTRYRSTNGEGREYPPSAIRKFSSDRDTFTPPHSRRHSRDSHYGSSGEERHPRRGTRADAELKPSRTSPHISSADESNLQSRQRINKNIDNEAAQKRPPTTLREDPRKDEMIEQSRTRKPLTSGDTAFIADPSRRSYHAPITPMTSDAAKSMEDCFARAFKENEGRPSKNRHRYRSSGSAVASPLTSPPRTPKSERQSKDYFELDTPSQRPAQRSRPPSLNEGPNSSLRAHATLLSAATVGAALAVGAAGDAYASTRAENTPRSSRPSLVPESQAHLVRSGSATQMDTLRSLQAATTQLDNARSASRGSIHETDRSQPYPLRSSSYSAYEVPRQDAQGAFNLGSEHGQVYTSPNLVQSPTVASRPAHLQAGFAEVFSQAGNNIRFPLCPRPGPVSGYRDWYSIKEMSNLDICPTCVTPLQGTRFKDLFVPSLPRPYNEPSVCAMSKPWMRIAFMRALRQGRNDLNYLNTLSTLPSATRPCAGDKPDVRLWFDIIDPSTKDAVPGFFACSACVRAIDTVFPELHHLLDRPKNATSQERICSLHTSGKHFPTFIDEFEKAASRCRGGSWRSVDVQQLANTLRKACRYGQCPRDKMLSSRVWHFIPEMPEFTICEECYEEVVWPLSDKSIARDVSKTTKIVPKRRNSTGNSGISCQLYSDRMRNLFREAVLLKDFNQLRDGAIRRHRIQSGLNEQNRLYEADQQYGIDRRSEIEKNIAIWRTVE